MNTVPQILTDVEVDQLFVHFSKDAVLGSQPIKAVRNYVMYLLMLDAGLRVGELVKLTSSTLYIDCEPVLSIIIECEKKKKRVTREIPCSVRLRDALKIYHGCLTTLGINNADDKVFLTAAWKPALTTRQVQRIIRTAGKAAIGRDIHPHMLRHTFATRLSKIAPMPVVQRLLGHEHISSTGIYTHPNSEDLRNAIDGLGNVQHTQ